MTSKTALITGITGQDGSYLAELLLSKGYTVHGVVRRSSGSGLDRIAHLVGEGRATERRLRLHHGDLSDGARLIALLGQVEPAEIYHLAAQSDVHVSFEQPEYTGAVTGLGTTRLLEALRVTGLPARFYQASSSEMFGATPPPQDEESPLRPRSPYAAAKVYGYWITRNYRESYGVHAVNGIMFNHESPRRGEGFVTRKIARAAARIARGEQRYLYLGNLDARRDWGYAPEYVEAMWRMLQRDSPDDYVVATGTSYSVRDFVAFCFQHVGLEWERHVRVDERYLRPSDVSELVGDASKAERELGWKPVVFAPDLARIMADAEMAAGRARTAGAGDCGPDGEGARLRTTDHAPATTRIG
ncbi:GDP-mannose 4,6-dehydratase [Streptomyces sp. CB03238]|uniref:GDP-mannose 4,6-dehydratase n=1 Tax=Streptomyces sp. CB03238 TaxID=1907777 RepID=UPI000A122621|nr:GDP-mannose 4,6-dehydratase [Streptomyces sp. CB03238]ORT56101.1 GDP-mannose 4,6-dehydratase [Streptomyces sp. CB03238]